MIALIREEIGSDERMGGLFGYVNETAVTNVTATRDS
jgi:hypothetical protein